MSDQYHSSQAAAFLDDSPMVSRLAFTLIELLIVVGIIGILAAIAIPNFLNAQIRAKLARVKADMRTIENALEMYHIDNIHYFVPVPIRMTTDTFDDPFIYRALTTPISYLSAYPVDPFSWDGIDDGPVGNYFFSTEEIDYLPYNEKGLMRSGGLNVGNPKTWALFSLAPDRHPDVDTYKYGPNSGSECLWMLYSPSNGLVSSGDLVYSKWAGMQF
ncbi:MAG TPA: prepilin-type N-terminal cleavage/methylation domain-containing protein [bacterium]|nr:prepilin-type N-terminal cleavage/methylation domain-containing protein [bacterium]HQQ00836.1 prepilin-type N-terminal cleavage/methylation domain-containing protein [bacterium]